MITLDSATLNAWIAAWIWPFIRVLALLNTAPVFDSKSISRKVRFGLTAMMAILLSGILPPPPTLSDTQAMLILAQQIMVGASLGFTLKLIFSGFDMAGDFIGLQMGLSFAQFIDPQRNSSSPLIGSLLSLIASLIFFSLNGHLMMLAAITKTFEMVPIGVDFSFLDAKRIVLIGGMLFAIALQIALPVLAALLTANVVLGILTRAAPQMNIMSIGFAVTLLTGFWVLWMSLPYFSGIFEQTVMRILQVPVINPTRP